MTAPWTPVLDPTTGQPCRHTPIDTDPDSRAVTCRVCETTWTDLAAWVNECALTQPMPWITPTNTPPPARVLKST
jgi:hypothetical protein